MQSDAFVLLCFRSEGSRTADAPCIGAGGTFMAWSNGDPLLVVGGGGYSSNVGHGGVLSQMRGGTLLPRNLRTTISSSLLSIKMPAHVRGRETYPQCLGVTEEDADSSYSYAGTDGNGGSSTQSGGGYYSDCDTLSCAGTSYYSSLAQSFMDGGAVGGYCSGTDSFGAWLAPMVHLPLLPFQHQHANAIRIYRRLRRRGGLSHILWQRRRLLWRRQRWQW